MKNQLHSFYYAIRGLLSIFQTEGHMRFHLVAAVYVVAFCLGFYNLSATQWAVLTLTICSVLTAEIINTAVERLCDKITREHCEHIKFIKDASAGAVLLCAVMSVIIAFILLYDTTVFCNIISYYIAHPMALVILMISIVISVLFVAIKPSRYTGIFTKNKNKKD